MAIHQGNKLSRELGLFDIVAISTGAMISSGFFLLPGIAASYTGPSVYLAYLFAALLMLPPMFSMAELATATPRAGGAYFFIDRSLGPMFGTIGGLGNYLALIMKTSFALVGIGAYAVLFFELPVKLTAIIFGLAFMAVNILGAKKGSQLQKVIVFVMIIILLYFIAEGLREVFFSQEASAYRLNFRPFMPKGIEALASTTALVYVSYLGLTKIASMSEEIVRPERNIPLGLLISLSLATLIYVAGVYIMVSVIPAQELYADTAPAATAAGKVFTLVPPKAGLLLIVIAAVFAFASTGNSGLMTASRYPLAMARDRLLPPIFGHISRFNTPGYSIIITSLFLFIAIALLSESEIAKLASGFQLLLFILVNFSVIVMRESRIEAYDPGYYSPFYPWMQIFGIISAFILMIYLGWGASLFTGGTVAIGLAWYWHYGRRKARREGALYHWFARLGTGIDKSLENEFLHILKEKGLRDGDPFGEMIVNAEISLLGDKRVKFKNLVTDITRKFANRLGGMDRRELMKEFLQVTTIDPALVIPRVSILHGRIPHLDKPMLHIVISHRGVRKPIVKGEITSEDNIGVFFFLLCNSEEPKMQLRLLSRLMDIVERQGFIDSIITLTNHREIKEYLLHNDRYITLTLSREAGTSELIGKSLKELRLPTDVLMALIQRGEQIFTPRGDTVLKENDIVTIIGEPKGIETLFVKYLKRKA